MQHICEYTDLHYIPPLSDVLFLIGIIHMTAPGIKHSFKKVLDLMLKQ